MLSGAVILLVSMGIANASLSNDLVLSTITTCMILGQVMLACRFPRYTSTFLNTSVLASKCACAWTAIFGLGMQVAMLSQSIPKALYLNGSWSNASDGNASNPGANESKSSRFFACNDVILLCTPRRLFSAEGSPTMRHACATAA